MGLWDDDCRWRGLDLQGMETDASPNRKNKVSNKTQKVRIRYGECESFLLADVSDVGVRGNYTYSRSRIQPAKSGFTVDFI